MYTGKRLLVKHEGKLIEGNVQEILAENLIIKLDSGTIITRKYWEVRNVKNEEE